jgi:hypothetical protein
VVPTQQGSVTGNVDDVLANIPGVDEVEEGTVIERLGQRAPVAMNRSGMKKQSNPVFGKMQSIIGMPTFKMPEMAMKKSVAPSQIGNGMIANAKKVSGCKTSVLTLGSPTPPMPGLMQVVGGNPKKKATRPGVTLDISTPSILKKRRR